MNQIIDSIVIALQAVWANKLRSLMTVLGNVVAVTSIVTVVSLIQGLNATVSDLIVSDIGLPDGTGLDLIRHIHHRRPIPALAVSGYGMEEDIRSSREAGFSEHLVKPVDLGNLRAAIERVLASSIRR